MSNSEITNNISDYKQKPAFKNAAFWHIVFLMTAFSVFYYMDVIIDYEGWVNMRWEIFYTVHDLHRALFLIPVMYATYAFRLKGIIVTSLISLLVFLPRALLVSPYPDPLLRALTFFVTMTIMAVLLYLLLNDMDKCNKLEQNLSQAQNDLLLKQAEEALRESEDKYKSLIDNVPDIIFTIDLEGKITFVSKRTKEILGYENTETITRNIFSFIPEEDHQRAIENLQKGMKGEKIKHFPIPMIAKSGEKLIFECSFTRIYKDGAVVGAQGTAVDITERKKAEEALRESEELFRLLSESTFEAIVIHEKGVILNANEQYFKMFGYEPYEALGKEMISVTIAPESLEFVNAQVAKDSLEPYESIGLRKDGTRFPIMIRTRKMKYKGRTVRFGAIRDITERKRAEEALRKSEEKYRLIFEYSPLGLLSFDEKGVIVACNDNFVKIIGSSREKLIGLNMLNLPDKNIVSVVQKALNGGPGFYEGDYSSTTAKKITPVRCLFTPMDIGDGRIPGGVGIIEDITERKKKEEVHNQLAAIVESADDAIISKNLEGIIVSWNNGAEVEYGYSSKEVIGKSISLLMPPDNHDDYKKILSKIAHDEKIKHYEVKRRKKDGQIIDVSLTISPLKDASGKIIGASTIARDITQRKQAEEDIRLLNEELEKRVLQRTAQLNEVNRELEKFSYSVSHDLRAPLRSIDGWSLALLEDYGDKLDDQARKYLDRVRTETQMMGILINDLLNLSRITRIELQVAPLDLTAMARSITSRLHEERPDRRIEFIIQPDLRADGDNHMINIALTNLFENAVKFTGKRIQARIEFGEAEVDGEKAFFVRDNGAGFDMANVDKLFGAFQRLHKSSEFSGTGIGLATVQRIIHRHGRRIWASARVDQGATFYFTLKDIM